MIFRQLFDRESSTYTYLLADERKREAILIDPVFEQHARDAALIRELGLTLLQTLDTHCHADHVTGAWLMKQTLGSRIALAGAYGADNVDVPLAHGDVVRCGDHALSVRATPGHTDGCLSFVTADERRVFTGDALLIRGAGRTDFQAGDAAQLYRSIKEQLFTLPESCEVLPAHDYAGRESSTIGEERAWNPRIGGEAAERDFVGHMSNLGLPHPGKIAVAVPANMKCGWVEDEPDGEANWAPLVRTYAGGVEIDPMWIAEHRDEVHILDVRESYELHEGLGALEDAQSIPLGELRSRLDEVPSDRPVAVICHAGSRSAMAAKILLDAGRERVANVRGGMVAWARQGLTASRRVPE